MGYTLGEESFDDADADGYFSAGNPFTDLGEPFLDEDGMGYNPPDFFVDWNSTGLGKAIQATNQTLQAPVQRHRL